MRNFPGLLAVLLAAAFAACSNEAASGGDDAAPTDDATADSATDAATGATDAANDTAAGKDIAGDAADAQVDGPKDIGVADAVADALGLDASPPDAGQDSAAATDVDVSLCNTACASIAAAQCPQDSPTATCVQSCIELEVGFGGQCPAEIKAYMQCIATTKVICVDGLTDQNTCASQMATMSACMSGPVNPGKCAAGSCYGGQVTCGCDTTCNNVDVKLDCNGTTCTCTTAGAVSKTFPQGAACTGDVSSFLASACVP